MTRIFTLQPHDRGYHIITQEVLQHLGDLPQAGVLHLFIQHTSAAITINENADPDVLHDFELYFNHLVPEVMPGQRHTIEGPDDMPAHIKAAMIGYAVTVPIVDGRLALGTWQGIYLCEFRNQPRPRTFVATLLT